MSGNNGKSNPLISVAIIARNCRDDVYRLLLSLDRPLNDFEHEISFVDNGSTDGTLEMLREKFQYVKVHQNENNRGVAAARNQSLKQCAGDFILILDADCEYREGNFNDAIDYLNTNKEIGILGFRVYYPNMELQDTARTLPMPIDLLVNRMDSKDNIRDSEIFRRHRMLDFDPMKPREAGFVAGACQFFNRKLLDEIGYLDESMFYGYEDSDFCARIIASGRKVVYYPKLSFIHHHQRLTKKKPFSQMTFIQMRSYFIFHSKHKSRIRKINKKLIENNSPPSMQ